MGNKIKIGMIVSGFPTQDNPSHGVFNLRAAESLCELVDLTVIHLRLWRPGRKFIDKRYGEKYKHFIISAPYFPYLGKTFYCSSINMYYRMGVRNLEEELKDIDIFHSVGAAVAGILGSRWAERYSKHNILEIIGTDVNLLLPDLLKLHCFRGFGKWIHGVGCDSMALKRKYEEIIGKIENIEVIYKGVNLKKFKPFVKNSLGERKTKFLFLGGIPFYKVPIQTRNIKGGETLMEGWKSYEDEFKINNCELVFAGPDSSSSIAREWHSSLKHKDSVKLAGALKPEEVVNYLKEADVVLLPSLYEGMPNVAFEAAASGKCIISTNVGGIPELIENDVSGILVEPGEPKTLTEAMLKVSRDNVLVSKYGRNARETVERKFNSESFAPNYYSFYKSVLQTFI